MKQGSADDPFADDSTETNSPPDDKSKPGTASASDTPAQGSSSSTVSAASSSTQHDDRPSAQQRSLPYIHARDGVKDGRTQRPVFLRDHIEEGIDDLRSEVEDELGEDVYKTDVTEAAMAIAQEHPGLVLKKLREWGYGWR